MKTRTKTSNRHNAKHKRTFTLKEYNSGDGMVTSTWGPAIWHFIHMISFNYPANPTTEDKKYYRNFIFSLKNILPCKYCRINLKKNLKQMPLTLEHMKNRESFSRYVYELHELVNHMLKKQSGLSYCDVRERYEHFRSRCTQNAEDQPKLFSSKEITQNAKYNKTMKHKRENNATTKKNEHKGCTEPLWGKKSKCILKIVPQEDKTKTFSIDHKCIKHKI